MSPTTNSRVLFADIPEEHPIPGKTTKFDTSETIDLDNIPLNGGFLLKTLVLSPDPYMRRRMRDPSIQSYSAAFELNQSIVGHGIGVVIRSESSKFPVGSKWAGPTIPWQEYSILDENNTARFNQIPEGLNVPLSTFIGINGMPGQAAWYGLREYGHLKQGDVAFISTAAGAVGAVVAQLAKLAGAKVIASTGSDDKVTWLKNELGLDVVFNYKTTSTEEILKKEGPINLYWDNVGGPTLEAAIEHSAVHARFIICGQISEYNTTERYGIKNTNLILWKRLSVNGFIWSDLITKYGFKPFYDEVPQLVADGKIKFKEHITKGLENADKALAALFQGDNFGKSIVIVEEE
jgi:NADPH-dependent curcumin reductase CurA